MTLTWLITGCSSGIGRALALEVLDRGDIVIATARDCARVEDLVRMYPSTAHAFALDVSRPERIATMMAEAHAITGHIDVVVNNAAIGYLSAIEEGDDTVIRSVFETNFFGLAAIIRSVLPSMRARGRGTIVNISSLSGHVSFPGLGYYSASKFALEGLSEALWQEVEPLGLKVLLVELGAFRTGVVNRTPRAAPISDYASTAGATRKHAEENAVDTSPGDPERAAEIIVDMVGRSDAPHRLFLGSDALSAVSDKLSHLLNEVSTWRDVSVSSDFAEG